MDHENRQPASHPTHERYFRADEAFTPAEPAIRRELFAGRQVALSQLHRRIGEPGAHLLVVGESGVGRTSLVLAACDLAAPGGAPIVTLQPQDTLATLWDRVAQATGMPGDGPWTPEGVARWGARWSGGRRRALVIESCEIAADDDFRAALAATLAALAAAAPAVTVVLVSLAGDAEPALDLALARAERVAVPRMTHEECVELALRALEVLHMTSETAVVERMATLSNGLPGAMQGLGHAAARAAALEGARHITNAHLAAAVTAVLEAADEGIRQAYEQAIVRARRGIYPEILLACALAPRDELGMFSVADVRATVQSIVRREVRGLTNQVAALTEEGRGAILAKKGAASTARYRFVQPRLEPYILLRGLEAGWATSRTPVWLPAEGEVLELHAA